MTDSIEIMPPVVGCSRQIEPILRALPEWFGIEESLVEYVEMAKSLPTMLAMDGDQPVGFLMIKRHFPESAEVYCIGLLPSHHRRGIGRRLQDACEAHLRKDGVRYLQVKTIDPAKQCEAYLLTVEFYRSMGFEPLEVFPELWDPSNPCLLLLKTL